MDDITDEEQREIADAAATDAERRYQARERGLRAAVRDDGIATTAKFDAAIKAAHADRWHNLRPPIERYVRCSVELPGGSVELGLLYDRGEPLTSLSDKLRELAVAAARAIDGPITLEVAEVLSADLEALIVALWGDRAWFLEVWNADSALTQIYAPHGMPRRS